MPDAITISFFVVTLLVAVGFGFAFYYLMNEILEKQKDA